MDKVKKVALIEDEGKFSDIIADKLNNRGVTVEISQTVERALEMLGTDEQFDLIWLDHYLPSNEGKSGMDVLSFLRGKEVYRNTPVYVVSNTGGHAKQVDYMNMGATKYFVKAESSLEDIVNEAVKLIG